MKSHGKMLLLITATEREMRSALSGYGATPPLRQGVAESWRVGNRSCALLVTGVGLINAAFALGQTLTLPGLDGAINFGVAGSFDLQRFPLCSTAVIQREIWPEYGLECSDNGTDVKSLGFPLRKDTAGTPDADTTIWDRLELHPDTAASTMDLHLDAAWPLATSLSVSTVTTTAGRAARFCKSYAPDVENMEGFALAYGCACVGLPFLELRTVSNRVGSRAAEHWNFAGALSALRRSVTGLLG